MVDNEESFLLYMNTHYNNILNTSKQFGEYTEFKNRYNILISQKPINKKECDKFLCNFFKKVLEEEIKKAFSGENAH